MFVSEVQISFKLLSEIIGARVPSKEKIPKEENGSLVVTKETAPEVGTREEVATCEQVGYTSLTQKSY